MRDRRALLLTCMAALLAAMVARMAGLDWINLDKLVGGLALVAAVLTAAALGLGIVVALPVTILIKFADWMSRPRTEARR